MAMPKYQRESTNLDITEANRAAFKEVYGKYNSGDTNKAHIRARQLYTRLFQSMNTLCQQASRKNLQKVLNMYGTGWARAGHDWTCIALARLTAAKVFEGDEGVQMYLAAERVLQEHTTVFGKRYTTTTW